MVGNHVSFPLRFPIGLGANKWTEAEIKRLLEHSKPK